MWSSVILQEVEYEETRKLVERGALQTEAEQRGRRLINQMRVNFNDAEVHGWEALEGTFELPDPDDEQINGWSNWTKTVADDAAVSTDPTLVASRMSTTLPC